MNQQRSRRFRSAHDAAEARMKAEEIKREQGKRGFTAPTRQKLVFDTNCITPGTEFMYRLGEHMDFFIKKKMHEDPLWKDLKVILSGPSTPGEGEHKIMEYIRAAKTQPDYEPNLRHCIYGLDADLIMLSLASHEPHFSLLREEVIFDKAKSRDASSRVLTKTDSFQLLHIGLYREYLGLEILEGSAPIVKPPTLMSGNDDYYNHESFAFFKEKGASDGRKSRHECMERVVDDFILFCFMIGNDFLPHLHYAEIGEGGLAQLIQLYKAHLRENGLHESSFIAKNEGEINWPAFFKLFYRWSRFEHEKLTDDASSHEWLNIEYKTMGKNKDQYPTDHRATQHELLFGYGSQNSASPLSAPPVFGQKSEGADAFKGDGFKVKKKAKKGGSFVSVEEAKRDWYIAKMDMDVRTPEGTNTLNHMIEEYLRGLQWVLFYYFKGVPSWDWFYPYHYAPWAEDVMNSSFARDHNYKPSFELGAPFTPFQQLMSVMPPECANLLPPLFHNLMLDLASPIKDFYPHTIQVDMEGVKVEWGGIILVPFIDSKRLVTHMNAVIKDSDEVPGKEKLRLSVRDRMRNRNTLPNIYWRDDSLAESASIVSTLASKYPSIPAAKIVTKVYELPAIPAGVRANVRLPKTLSSLPGFPTLHSLRVRPCYAQGVKQFQFESKSDSLFLSASQWDAMSKETFKAIIDAPVVHVDYPYIHLAKLEALVFPDFILKINSSDSSLPDSERFEIEPTKSTHGYQKIFDDLSVALQKRGIYIAHAAKYDPSEKKKEMNHAENRKLASFFDSDVENIPSSEEQNDDEDEEIVLVKKPEAAAVHKKNKSLRKERFNKAEQDGDKPKLPSAAELFADIDFKREMDEHNSAGVNMYSIENNSCIHPVIERAVRLHVLTKGPNAFCRAFKVVAVVRPVSSLGLDEKGALKMTVAAETRTYPLAHIVPLEVSELSKWETFKSASVSSNSLKPGQEVLVLGQRSTLFGSAGTVKAIRGASVDVEVVCTTMNNAIGGDYERVPFLIQDRVRAACNKSIASEQWFSFKDVAVKLEVPEGTIRMIAGQFFVNEVRGESGFPGRENLGLNLVLFHGVNAPLIAPGYARCRWKQFGDGSGRWEADLSSAAVEAFTKYKETYPMIFTSVNTIGSQGGQFYNNRDGNNSVKKTLSSKQLFPASKDPNYELGQVAAWVNRLPCRQPRLVPASHCIVLPMSGIEEVGLKIDQARSVARNNAGLNETTELVYNTTIPAGDLRITSSTAPLPESLLVPEPCIGQRVVYAHAEGAVPVGTVGTVVGLLGAKRVRSNDGKGSGGRIKSLAVDAIDGKENGDGKNDKVAKEAPVAADEIEVMVEILLDTPYLGAGNLNGRCEAGRGLIVSPDHIIPLFPRINKNGAYEGKNDRLPEGTKKTSRTVPFKPLPAPRDLIAEATGEKAPSVQSIKQKAPDAPPNADPFGEEDSDEETILVTNVNSALKGGPVRANSKQTIPGAGITEGVLAGFGVVPNTKNSLESLFSNAKISSGKSNPSLPSAPSNPQAKRWNVPLTESTSSIQGNALPKQASVNGSKLLKEKLQSNSNNGSNPVATQPSNPSIPTQAPIPTSVSPAPPQANASKKNVKETVAPSDIPSVPLSATAPGKQLLAMLKGSKKDDSATPPVVTSPSAEASSASEVKPTETVAPSGTSAPVPPPAWPFMLDLQHPSPLLPPFPPMMIGGTVIPPPPPAVIVPTMPIMASPFVSPAASSQVIIIPAGVHAIYSNGMPAIPLGTNPEQIKWAPGYDYKNPTPVFVPPPLPQIPFNGMIPPMPHIPFIVNPPVQEKQEKEKEQEKSKEE
eukprot:GDKJ01001222.1.p1 GENE.GDKJ01001222.1~~GDKJ01001222.1.p1  ORF type:complete len:1914 (+),score=527.19 GDKJ01001222.1:300-5744(+)